MALTIAVKIFAALLAMTSWLGYGFFDRPPLDAMQFMQFILPIFVSFGIALAPFKTISKSKPARVLFYLTCLAGMAGLCIDIVESAGFIKHGLGSAPIKFDIFEITIMLTACYLVWRGRPHIKVGTPE